MILLPSASPIKEKQLLFGDKKTGKPLCNAIVWQDRRTADYCDSLKQQHAKNIQQKTGLIIDAYFSAT